MCFLQSETSFQTSPGCWFAARQPCIWVQGNYPVIREGCSVVGGSGSQGGHNKLQASRRGRVFHACFMHEIPCKSFDSARLRLALVSFATRASHGLCINTAEVLMAVRLCLDYFLIILDSHSWAGSPRASSCIPHIIALWRRSAHTNICRDSLNNLFQELLLPLRVAQ